MGHTRVMQWDIVLRTLKKELQILQLAFCILTNLRHLNKNKSLALLWGRGACNYYHLRQLLKISLFPFSCVQIYCIFFMKKNLALKILNSNYFCWSDFTKQLLFSLQLEFSREYWWWETLMGRWVWRGVKQFFNLPNVPV